MGSYHRAVAGGRGETLDEVRFIRTEEGEKRNNNTHKMLVEYSRPCRIYREKRCQRFGPRSFVRTNRKERWVIMLPVFLLVASLVSVEGLHNGPCWGYDVLCTTADYQFRHYNESVWVGIYVSRVFFHGADTLLLNQYFKQQNSEGMQIQMTGQALISLSEHGGSAIYLMLPEELWDNPPTATNPRVFVTRLPMMDVFARTTRQFRFSDVGDFNHTLTEQNVPVNNSNFFIYSCMSQEIWFVSTGGFDCPAP